MKIKAQPVIIICAVIIISFITLLIIEHFTFEAPKNHAFEALPSIVISDSELPDLFEKYSANKLLPVGYEKEAIIALAHFPELIHEEIEFLIEPALFPLASRPAGLSLIFPWITRKYYIIISNRTFPSLRPILFFAMPFEARIGVLGHELAHIAYYRERSGLQILRDGICYLFPEFRQNFEKETDLRTIRHGLGEQLYAWSIFLQSSIEKYPEIKATRFVFEERYLKPQEIEAIINKEVLIKY